MSQVDARAALIGAQVEVSLDLGPGHGGWTVIDSWTPDGADLAGELKQHGWAVGGPLDEPEHGVVVAPSDWSKILRAATGRKSQLRGLASRTDTAWNVLVAEAPSKGEPGGLSVIEIAELTDVGRHRVYGLRGQGKSRPKFTLD